MVSKVNIAALMENSGVKFGTSGARGLVADMNDRVCFIYTTAFLLTLEEQRLIEKGMKVAVAGDYRPSTPRIMHAVAAAIKYAGFSPVSCGFVPTPALALYSMQRGIPSMMVTGSHIPDDRNGIKFYKPQGEVLKSDEAQMSGRDVLVDESLFDDEGMLCEPVEWHEQSDVAYQEYISRYTSLLPQDCLKGKRVGVYEHSSVARAALVAVFEKLGAEVTSLGRSEQFIPVDTEAIRPEDERLAVAWSQQFGFDCIVSADGDGDRPLVSDEHGRWLRGDVAGILCAQFLSATHVVTPVSSNSAVEASGLFSKVARTRIGSPFVIEAMSDLMGDSAVCVVGYEANGGFLTAVDIRLNDGVLVALPTRDAVIVPLAILLLSVKQNMSVGQLLKTLSSRFTSSGRIENLPTEKSGLRMAPLQTEDVASNVVAAEALFAADFGKIDRMGLTDGVRMFFASGEIVHLRPSGNAPELRCYTEAVTAERADVMRNTVLSRLAEWK